MKEVNADLYEFLNNNETGMYPDKSEVMVYVFVSFYDVVDFVNAVGKYHFEEGGRDCKLQETGICIDINYFIESEGHKLSSYKNCFSKNDWDNYGKQILKSEED